MTYRPLPPPPTYRPLPPPTYRPLPPPPTPTRECETCHWPDDHHHPACGHNVVPELSDGANSNDSVHAAFSADPSPSKDTNPKDAVGTGKAPMSTVPAPVIAEIGLGMLEGARKYGRHNYRVAGVRASVYYDATMRHLMAWWEGEDIDPDTVALDDQGQPIPGTGISHVTKAMCSLAVLRDAQMNSMCTDDRPPRSKAGWVPAANAVALQIVKKYPSPVPAYRQIDEDWDAEKDGQNKVPCA